MEEMEIIIEKLNRNDLSILQKVQKGEKYL